MEIAKKKNKSAEKTTKGVTRREFLKDAGMVVGGAALGSIALASACAATKTTTESVTSTVTSPPITKQGETVTSTAITTTTVTPPATTVTQTVTIPVSQWYLVGDPKKCAACNTCGYVCSMAHEGTTDLSVARIQVMYDTFGAYPTNVIQSICRQCANPPCYLACPLKDKALCIDATTGVRYVNEQNCIGCGACVQACVCKPSAIVLGPGQGSGTTTVAKKCDLCRTTPNWTSQGQQACVQFCPEKALQVTKVVPNGADGYVVNLRGAGWAALGMPTD
jgi:Fe-S-cluster-containing dehydrogenase component